MNLVMSDITRNKLGCYMAQQASLNNIPVSALVSRFTVEPSVQQRFENAVKESTEFTKKINVFGVTDQKGEKILLDTTGPIARTNTSYDGTKRRNPNNVVDLKNRKYQCEQVNYDTFISYPQLDAWAAHPDFQSRVSTQIARQVALDRIMIGFNGTSHADESNFSTNKLLQDVNVGYPHFSGCILAGYCAARAASGGTTAGPRDHLPPAAYCHRGCGTRYPRAGSMAAGTAGSWPSDAGRCSGTRN